MCLHHAQLVLHAEQRAENVRVEGRGITFCRLLGDRARLALGAGIVDCNIEAAEAGDGPIDEIAYLFLVTDVGGDEFRVRAKRLQLGREPLANILASASDDETRAFLCEGDGGRAADTGQRACDQNNGFAHRSSPSRYGRPKRASSTAGVLAGFKDDKCEPDCFG